MLKSSPLSVMKMPLLEFFPTASEEVFQLLSQRDVPAEEVCTARNRGDLDTMSLDDLYNHLKVYEPEVQKKSELNSHNMAFISSSKNSSGKAEVNTASIPTASTYVSSTSADVATANISLDTVCAYIASQSNGSQIKYEDINQIDEDDIEEMDIKWNMALLSMRADKFWKMTGKKITKKGTDVAGFDKSKVECFNCHKIGYFAREYRAPRSQDMGRREIYKQGSKEEEQAPKALMAIDGEARYLIRTRRDSDTVLFPPPSQVYSPPKKDMSWTGLLEFVDDTITDYCRPSPDIENSSTIIKTNKVETVRKPSIKYAEMYRNTSKSPKGNSQNIIDDKGYWDSGCSWHMTGNISYLFYYEPYDGGYVSFGQGGAKITGKGIIKIGKLKFENVYFVKDLNYNLFSVSQICDNKNSVLFTDSECIVLGRDFKLKDDTNVLLRTPRQHNMYSIELNNIVPHKDLTCLVAKASADESMLWHRRLGHLNFKTMNKLVRHNLVKGLPSKCFENNHTCVACLKGKQHKASWKTKLVNSMSKPLHTLHMDLFGPTSVSSLNHKWYCLVVTGDFSRFTWTFFLKTKDETSGILRNFITKIENLKDLKVKTIRCDNEGEFKNREMNEFCTRKGIKRKFSNARTPQQNGVAERKNRTLIEAARTMLADAKLPVTFWAKAVNTACYVQNRVLVNKSQNKTPYELFNGRTPAIGFIKPFGCHVMILNTLDHLGKFDTKGDEGYLIGYSMSMVVAGTPYTNFLGTKDAASQYVKKDVSSLRYIALQNWFHEAHLESSTGNAQDACNADAPESSGNSNPTATSTNPLADQLETLTVDLQFPLFEDILRVTTNIGDTNGVEADLGNMEYNISASPTPTFRIHKDHPKSQIIDHVDTPVQTRHKSKEMEEQSFIATIHQKTTLDLLQFLYQMDVKSAFLYGTIDEEVYVMQPLGFQDPEFPARVYKVEKAMYGLHQAPRAWYDTLSKYLLTNGFQKGIIDQTMFIRKHRGDFILVQVKFPTGNSKLSTSALGNNGKAGNSQINIDDKGYWDSGFSRYMNGNISYLSDYEPYDGGSQKKIPGPLDAPPTSDLSPLSLIALLSLDLAR
nr:putative ribonuclease H-like domain-containing protein [Tanacetum cinerariifolium]